MTTTPQAASVPEREAFEAWAQANVMRDYSQSDKHLMWWGWQARAALDAQKSGQPSPQLRICLQIQGGETHSTFAEYMSDDIGYLTLVRREWLPAAPADFPPRIMALLQTVADRNPTGDKLPWQDEHGEPMQDDAEAAIAWIKAQKAGKGPLVTDLGDSRPLYYETPEAAAPALVGWQPIESAPKDGTPVLVAPGLWTGRPCSIARYDLDKYAKKPRPYWDRDDSLGQVSHSRQNPPTLWMPLPPTPAGALPGPAQEKAAICQSRGIKPLGTTGGEG